jgi:hypothetical protein
MADALIVPSITFHLHEKEVQTYPNGEIDYRSVKDVKIAGVDLILPETLNLEGREVSVKFPMQYDGVYLAVLTFKPTNEIHLLLANISNDDPAGELISAYVPIVKNGKYCLDIYLQEYIVDSLDVAGDFDQINELLNNPTLELIGHTSFYYTDPPASTSSSPSRRVGGSRHLTPEERHERFKPDSQLSAKEESFCSCLTDVEAKNPNWCNNEQAWGETRGSETCYSPYAVCAKSTHTSSQKCGVAYDFHSDKFDQKTVEAYARVHGVPVLPSDTKESLIRKIEAAKSAGKI